VALERFFHDLPEPIDHVLVTAGGPYYARLADMDFAQARRGAVWLAACGEELSWW
jgi:hypothetical protein